MAEPISTGVGLIVVGVLSFFGYLTKKSYDSQEKAAEMSLKEKENQTEQTKIKKWQEEYDERRKKEIEFDNRIKKRDEEIKDIYDKLKKPNLTEKEKKDLQENLALLLSQQENDKRERENNNSILGQLMKNIENAQEFISKNLSSSGKKSWVWDLFTLENMVIAGGCYMAYKLLKDDK